jgi:hypothetical protein
MPPPVCDSMNMHGVVARCCFWTAPANVTSLILFRNLEVMTNVFCPLGPRVLPTVPVA